MKEKIVTLVNILGEGVSEINGPFYINNIIIDSIRLFDGEPEFNIRTEDKCQFGDFEFWMIYENMKKRDIEIIVERLANLL